MTSFSQPSQEGGLPERVGLVMRIGLVERGKEREPETLQIKTLSLRRDATEKKKNEESYIRIDTINKGDCGGEIWTYHAGAIKKMWKKVVGVRGNLTNKTGT